jgi:hypothetical protein
MSLSSAARSRWILAGILLTGIIIAARLMRRRPPQYPDAYVGDRSATIWSTTAQVRQTVATLHYGERVAVVRRTADQSQIRTNDGIQGWIDNRLLMDPELWRKSASLLASVHDKPIQASGRTRTLSNVRLEPGRDAPRIFQFGRGVPVAVYERKSVPVPVSAKNAQAEESPPKEEAISPDEDQAKARGLVGEEHKNETREDWLLVSRVTPEKTIVSAPSTGSPVLPPSASSQGASNQASYQRSPAIAPETGPVSSSPVSAGTAEIADSSANLPVAGWVLARFIELQPPEPIPDYSNAAGMHVVAWVVLNTVADAGGAKPQYLVAGARGGEGQPCDFTLLRAYTWGTGRQRYETAYVENNLCGKLPIVVRQTTSGPEFSFSEGDSTVQRVYRMRQTMIRRVVEGGGSQRKRRSSSDRVPAVAAPNGKRGAARGGGLPGSVPKQSISAH